MITQSLIEEKIIDSIQGSPCGSYCAFVPITESIGAKLYFSESERDRIYERQNRAFEHGLGPNTYGVFSFTPDRELRCDAWLKYKADCEIFGYLTEIVETFADGSTGNVENGDRIPEFEQIEKLRENLSELDFYFTDDHYGNLGWRGDTLLCIDFG
jgi:hypothetical protein